MHLLMNGMTRSVPEDRAGGVCGSSAGEGADPASQGAGGPHSGAAPGREGGRR